jgi:hypothetical protein
MRALMLLAFLPGCVCVALVEPLLGVLPGTCGQYDHPVASITDYRVERDAVTPKGVAVDRSGQTVDLGQVDAIVDEVERCLNEGKPDNPVARHFQTVQRCALRVKVAPDWITSPSGVQIFPCRAATLWCTGAEQASGIAVVTPNLRALGHEIAHVVTGADDGTDVMARCGG